MSSGALVDAGLRPGTPPPQKTRGLQVSRLGILTAGKKSGKWHGPLYIQGGSSFDEDQSKQRPSVAILEVPPEISQKLPAGSRHPLRRDFRQGFGEAEARVTDGEGLEKNSFPEGGPGRGRGSGTSAVACSGPHPLGIDQIFLAFRLTTSAGGQQQRMAPRILPVPAACNGRICSKGASDLTSERRAKKELVTPLVLLPSSRLFCDSFGPQPPMDCGPPSVMEAGTADPRRSAQRCPNHGLAKAAENTVGRLSTKNCRHSKRITRRHEPAKSTATSWKKLGPRALLTFTPRRCR